MLNKLKDYFIPRHDKTYPVSIDTLDITSYLSAPNLINTRNSHLGTIYRIFVDLSDMNLLEKHTPKYNLATHKMARVLKAFNREDVKIKEVLDWPISTGLGGEEWNKFFKQATHLNDYDPKNDLCEFQATIRYQVKNVEENIRNVNVFDQAERVFLEKYQQLRNLPDKWKPQNLFKVIKDEGTANGIKDKLQHFKIDSNSITCRDKGELLKLIPYINDLLYFFPEVKSQIDKALTETGLIEAIIDSQSKDYFGSISKYFQQFTEDEELKTLIRNTKQVSLISADEETSMCLARIYKAFAGNTAHDRTKHIWILEKLLYLKELLHSKNNITSFVDVLCKSKSLVLVECTLSSKLEDKKGLISDFLYCILKKIKDQPRTKVIFVVNRSNNGNWDDMIGSKAAELQIEYKMEKGMSPTWDNLSGEFQEELLNRPLIAFEGQKETSLKELMGDDNAACKDIVSDKEMLLALINNIKIPLDLNLPIASDYDEYYIERWFNNQIEVDINTFKETNTDDLLVFTDVDKARLEKLGFTGEKIRVFQGNDFTKESAHKFIIGNNNQANDAFRQLCTECPQDNFHWLMLESDKLIWHQSQGDISDLHRHIKKEEEHTRTYSENELLDINQRIMIIWDTAGMGKSVTLTKMAKRIKEQKSGSWVIRINLNDHTKELNKQKDKGGFKSTDKNEAIELAIRFIAQDLLNFGNSSKQVLCLHYCHRNMDKMILMLDGFDEISPDYKEVVIDLVQALLKTTIKQIWITTRPNMREDLEKTFQQFGYTLKPFSEDEQHNFLTKFWQRNSNEINNGKLQTYARALIKQLATSISDKDKRFTGIPLQTKMLAESFQEKCAEFCKSKETEPQLPENLDIIDLYERFLQQKYEIWQKEKAKLDLSNPTIKRQSESYLDFIEKHQDMALYALFNEAQFEILIKERLYQTFETEYDEFAEEVLQNKDLKEKLIKRLCQKKKRDLSFLINQIKEGKENKGVIDQVTRGKPHFVHLTFAEYLVAKFLVANSGNKTIIQFVLEELLIQENYEVIRAFFNGILAKEMLPGNSMNEYGEHIQKLWFENRSKLCNKEGFTILHIGTVENNAEIARFLLHSSRNYKNVLNSLLEACVYYSDLKYNALYMAAVMGHWKLVECLVENGADVNFRNENNDKILHGVGQSYDSEIVNFLVNKGATFYSLHQYGKTILHNAIGSGNLQIVKFLVEKGADIDAVDKNGDTIFHRASGFGNSEIVKYLVEKGADVNAVDKNGDTIFHRASRFGHLEIVKYLVETGADVEAINKNGDTILHFAAGSDNSEIVKYLVENEADVNSRNKNGYTILHSASRSGNSEIVKYLVEKGADVNAVDKDGDTILHIASQFSNLEIVKYLVETGADVDAINENGDTILHFAAESDNSEIVKYLVDKGADVNAVKKDGDTILHIASQFCNLEIVKYLVETGANVDAINENGDTILHIAIRFRNSEIVKYLMDKGADVNAVDKYGDTILHSASLYGNLEIVKYLMEKGTDVDVKNKNGDTILHSASRSRNSEIMKYLVKKGADVNAVNKDGDSILHITSESDNSEIVKYLVEKGADVDVVDRNGDTILHCASRSGNSEIVKYLVEIGADVNAKDEDSDTILHIASRSGNSEIVKYLVEKGADVNAVDKNGYTILHIASRSGNSEIVKYLVEIGADVNAKDEDGDTILHNGAYSRNSEIVKYLVEKGANVNAVNKNGYTVLHSASGSGDLEIVKYFVENGADVNAVNNNGYTVLHWASQFSNLEIVKYLVKTGADVNAVNKDGDTILHIAIRSGNIEIVKYLVKTGADVNAVKKDGDTILHSASRSWNSEIVKYLVEIGADVNAVNKDGVTILHSAFESGNSEIVKYLVEKGADVNAVYKDGNTMKNDGIQLSLID